MYPVEVHLVVPVEVAGQLRMERALTMALRGWALPSRLGLRR
ncbi:MAG TPA: hypothetical protein VMU55_08550 [Solirubrobacteraceae bacterium]|nr:hypothetical protein [Solirubrobacteraceae bacterium]